MAEGSQTRDMAEIILASRGQTRGIEDTILFNGSLAELNSIDPKRQYRFTDVISFGYHLSVGEADEIDQELEMVMKNSDYDGIVHRRTSFAKVDGTDHIYVEGTPIVMVK